jgi:hypothetical protein
MNAQLGQKSAQISGQEGRTAWYRLADESAFALLRAAALDVVRAGPPSRMIGRNVALPLDVRSAMN